MSISFRLSRRHARDPWRESWTTEAGKLCFPMSRSRVLNAMLALIEEIDRMGVQWQRTGNGKADGHGEVPDDRGVTKRSND